jgi:hypothetical protein
MTLSVCPITVVRSPAERVWALLAQPASYDTWWDAKTDAIVPPGAAQPGQQIRAHSRALGRDWTFHIQVVAVDQAGRQLELLSSYPFGIALHNDIRVTAVDSETARVSFG